jgi:amino acid transporter
VFLAMSFVGAKVAEAYTILLNLAVVLQLVPYLYLYAALLRHAAPHSSEPLCYSRRTLRLAGSSGLITTSLGMVVAFVPSQQIESVLAYELKMLLGCGVFLGLAVFFYARGRRAPAAGAP